ncbi:hypothetical protein ACHAXN_011548 [Cyclotella atomus]
MMISPIAAAFATQTGRIALVTGANKGIGFCIAVQLALSGLFSHIVLGCRDPTRGDAAVSRIQAQLNTISPPSASCTTISYLPLTLGDKQSHQQLRKSLEEQFGKVDVLINNAAMAYKGADPTPHEEQCKPTLDVNFRGTVDLTEELLPLLRLGNDARVVNVASMAGRLRQLRSSQLRSKFTSPELTMEELQSYVDQYERDVLDGTYQQKGWGGSNYGMSKLAVIAATRIWAREEAEHGIKVNCCCPGYCDTDMTSHRGTRSPEDGARNAVIPATMEHAPTALVKRLGLAPHPPQQIIETMAASKNEADDKAEKVMIPRRKLQSVPDLLANGTNEEDPSTPESWVTKTLWMAFLLTLFYLSFELFLKLDKMSREQNGGNNEL